MLRLNPPPVVVSRELEWLFTRSYHPIDRSISSVEPLDVEIGVILAKELDLAGRLVSRAGVPRIRDDLGSKAAKELFDVYKAIAVQAFIHLNWAKKIEELADQLGIPVVMMKGIALHRRRNLEPGSRPIADIDLLAPSMSARRLHSALKRLGFVAPDVHECEHHLPALRHPTGVAAEVHTKLLGVCVSEGRGSAAIEELIDRGLCIRDETSSPPIWSLDEDLLTAHLMVHALVHHRNDPVGYPGIRILGDLGDLEWKPSRWREFELRASGWLGRYLDSGDIAGVRELVTALGDGASVLDIVQKSGTSSRILRHLIASRTNRGYAKALEVSLLTSRLSDSSALASLIIRAKRNLFLSRAEVEYRYGSQSNEVSICFRRIIHPFIIIWRVATGYVCRLLNRSRPQPKAGNKKVK